MKIGRREEFERIRDADLDSLSTRDEKLMYQFLNGKGEGPLTDGEGISEFEKLLIARG